MNLCASFTLGLLRARDVVDGGGPPDGARYGPAECLPTGLRRPGKVACALGCWTMSMRAQPCLARYSTLAPKGSSASLAILKSWIPKGMPTTVMQKPSPQIT